VGWGRDHRAVMRAARVVMRATTFLERQGGECAGDGRWQGGGIDGDVEAEPCTIFCERLHYCLI
jgi:hypothetical protein